MLITKEECSQLLSRYEDALTSRIEGHKQKNRAQNLLELDRWRLTELRQAVQARDPSYMTLSELSKLMDCKLYSPVVSMFTRSRGTFRPRLKQLIENNSDKNVKEITEGGFLFAQTNDEEHIVQANLRAIKLLCELQGVGPATATMILQAKYDNVPFMSDEAMLQVFEGDKRKLKYDLRTCGDFMREVEEIRKKLSNGILIGNRE